MLADRAIIERIADSLGPDELRVLRRVAERLEMGGRQYGRLDIKGSPKDWRREASEEALDLAVYLSMELLRGE